MGHKTRLHQLGVSNSTAHVPLLVPSPNRDGTIKIREVEEQKAVETYFDIRLQGGWNCEGKSTYGTCRSVRAVTDHVVWTSSEGAVECRRAT